MMNTQEIINALTKDQIRTDLPELVVGNNVKVYQRIVEGSRTRTQMFEGTIIKVQGRYRNSSRHSARLGTDEAVHGICPGTLWGKNFPCRCCWAFVHYTRAFLSSFSQIYRTDLPGLCKSDPHGAFPHRSSGDR